MSPAQGRRILVALHPGDDLDDRLEHAARLDRELAGLFIEDQALFDLCELAAVEVS